jgi:hypothetical protein
MADPVDQEYGDRGTNPGNYFFGVACSCLINSENIDDGAHIHGWPPCISHPILDGFAIERNHTAFGAVLNLPFFHAASGSGQLPVFP